MAFKNVLKFSTFFMTAHHKPVGYNDLYLRIIISLIAAHIIVTFGAKESFFQLLISWFYYRSLLLSFIIAFFLISEVYYVTIKLDKQFDWIGETAKRIGLQLCFGLGLPSITAFLLATVYFALFGYNILHTYYLRFDFPVIVLMLLLLNIYYLAFYFYKQWRLSESRLMLSPVPEASNERKTKEIIVVQEGSNKIPLPIDNICYFYHDGVYNFARTRNREDFVIPQTLDELQQLLPGRQFFRVNRQMLVSIAACEHFRQSQFGKLELIVSPATKEPVTISQKRARQFKEWIER